jgi:hypothetical protein
MATTAAAIRVNNPAMAAVGAMPESNAARAESSSRSPAAGGKFLATTVAPLMLSPAVIPWADESPWGTSTLAR